MTDVIQLLFEFQSKRENQPALRNTQLSLIPDKTPYDYHNGYVTTAVCVYRDTELTVSRQMLSGFRQP